MLIFLIFTLYVAFIILLCKFAAFNQLSDDE